MRSSTRLEPGLDLEVVTSGRLAVDRSTIAREPVPTVTEDAAVALLDAGDEPFVCFIDPASG